MKKLRIGIIGTGGISHSHMQGYKRLDNLEVVAACDINEERLAEYAAKYDIPNTFTDYNEMVKMDGLDAVSVCTWNNVHAPAAIAALNAGLNVLCEKPLALNAQLGLDMEAAAKKNGKLLMVGFVRRFMQSTEIAKTFIDNGDLGEIYFVKTKCIRRAGNPCGWFADKKRSGGGPLIDLGVHMIDLSRYLLGKPKAVSVYGMTSEGIGPRNNIKAFDRYYSKDIADYCDVEDFTTAMVRFDSGAVLQVEVSFSANIKKDQLTLDLYGNKGGVTVEPDLEIYTEKYDYLTDITPVWSKSRDNFDDMFAREISHYVDCCLNGGECRNPVEDGVELMRILDAIYESAATKHEVIL